jgi:ppGpp synthetase/RelA/SpoT-type nucleotidyltranferase
MNITEQFLNRYAKEHNFYLEAARHCAEICEAGIEQNGIKAIVTHRAKRPGRLRDKLLARNKKNPYQSLEDIYRDIVDLAGVRIALYFPGDREEVRKLITNTFDVVSIKEFPSTSKPTYRKRFSGYWATHYRVRLKEDTLPDHHKHYAKALIEIQVASVLMHAWSEVEHDLVYKSFAGPLSAAEYAILDELNGLMLAGEISLEQLQRAVKDRIASSKRRFSNHYELSSYLYFFLKDKHPTLTDEPVMGRADILLRFLQLSGMDTPESIEGYLYQIEPGADTRPLVDQLIDLIISGNSKLYLLYQTAKQEVGARSLYGFQREIKVSDDEEKALGFFISRWIELEQLLRKVAHIRDPKSRKKLWVLSPTNCAGLRVFSDRDQADFGRLQQLRNQLVHGIERPDAGPLVEAGKRIEKLMLDLPDALPEKCRPAIRREVNRLLKIERRRSK